MRIVEVFVPATAGRTSQVKHSIGLYPRVRVQDDGRQVVSQAGTVLLVETARKTGLDQAISTALAPWRRPRAVHDPGKILLDVALAVALGGDCLADVAMLRCEPAVFGPVASDPTVSRLIDTLAASGEKALQAIRAARSEARHRAWALAGENAPDADGQITVDLDGVLVIAQSDKQDAAATWKKTYGHHPMTAFIDHGPGGTESVSPSSSDRETRAPTRQPTTSPPPNRPWPSCPSTTGEDGRRWSAPTPQAAFTASC